MFRPKLLPSVDMFSIPGESDNPLGAPVAISKNDMSHHVSWWVGSYHMSHHVSWWFMMFTQGLRLSGSRNIFLLILSRFQKLSFSKNTYGKTYSIRWVRDIRACLLTNYSKRLFNKHHNVTFDWASLVYLTLFDMGSTNTNRFYMGGTWPPCQIFFYRYVGASDFHTGWHSNRMIWLPLVSPESANIDDKILNFCIRGVLFWKRVHFLHWSDAWANCL